MCVLYCMDTVIIDLGEVEYKIDDAPRELMLENLRNETGESSIEEMVSEAINENANQLLPVEQIITELYDKRNQIAQMQSQESEDNSLSITDEQEAGVKDSAKK